MNDILPDKTAYWQYVEATCRKVVAAYGYREIRFPLLESTALFSRTIGEITDVVEKEMYTFTDRNGDSLTLRPEGTAGCVRAAIEHGLLHNQQQRLWYSGAMFRHERPQKGRYRQFYQLGVEAYGMAMPEIDAEIILLSARLLAALGLSDQVVLQLNTLGSHEARCAYREKLMAYLTARQDDLDEDSQRRLSSNPLRILDSKNPAMRDVIAEAPKMLDCLDDASRKHFDQLCEQLTRLNQPFVIEPMLVRGLDYYCMTVFEWVATTGMGAQATVGGGGRYDGMVELLGGRPTPAVGFACGLERLILLLEHSKSCHQSPDVFVICDAQEVAFGFSLVEQLRDAMPALRVEMHFSTSGFKSRFKRAISSGAEWALVLDTEKRQDGYVALKNLRDQQLSQQVALDQLISWFGNH